MLCLPGWLCTERGLGVAPVHSERAEPRAWGSQEQSRQMPKPSSLILSKQYSHRESVSFSPPPNHLCITVFDSSFRSRFTYHLQRTLPDSLPSQLDLMFPGPLHFPIPVNTLLNCHHMSVCHLVCLLPKGRAPSDHCCKLQQPARGSNDQMCQRMNE